MTSYHLQYPEQWPAKEPDAVVQIRSEDTGLNVYDNISQACTAAQLDLSVWKVSYKGEDGVNYRMVCFNTARKFTHQPINTEEIKKENTMSRIL